MSTISHRLPTWLADAAWLEESDRGGCVVVDEATLGPVRLLIVEGAGGRRYFAPVLPGDADEGAGLRDACGRAEFDRAVVDAMRGSATVPTQRGHSITFRGTPPAFAGPLAFNPGWSSNSLSLMDLAGRAHAHKTYRCITPGSREPVLLRAMAGSGQTQQPVGEYVYHGAAGDVPLGMIYVYAEGDGLDVPLRHSLRTLWPALAAGATVDVAVAHAVSGLERPLIEAGRFLPAFHTELARRLGVVEQVRVDDLLADTRHQVAEVSALIQADDRHPLAARVAVVEALSVEQTRAMTVALRDWPAGACHGDLHLSHFLRVVCDDGSWQMSLIDLATPALDPADPQFAVQSPWQDAVALLRGLACFTGDEFADRAGQDLDVDSAEICRVALLRAAGLDPASPTWTHDRVARLDRLGRAASAWQQRISTLLVDGYAGVAGPASTVGELTGHPAWRLLRLRRLLHELAYAYAHHRTYYADITLRHAIEVAAADPGSAS